MKREKSDAQAFYTTGQVASFCGVKTITVVRWIKRGELEAYSLPGRGDRRIPVLSLVRFLERNQLPLPDGIMKPGREILIVSETRTPEDTLTRTLTANGCRVRVAARSFQAGMEIEAQRPEVLMVDLSSHGLDGLGIIQWVKACAHLHAVFILAYAAEEAGEEAKARAAGADATLQGSDPEAILSCLAVATGRRSAFA